MTKLSNEQIQSIVNESYSQAIGNKEITEIDLTKFTDIGTSDVQGLRERFTGALLGVLTKNWYTDTSYRSSYKDVFYEDSERFGAIMQAITVEVPEVKENSAWKDFVSGTSTVGQYTVYLPIVSTKYYTKSESWALPITITGEQYDTAFRSMYDLNEFVNYVFLMVDNALVQHLEDMDSLNRNNFISEKVAYANSVGAEGVHVVDLVGRYVAEKGITTSYSITEALNDKDFLLFCIKTLMLFKEYFKKQTSLFNTEGKTRFTPDDRLVIQMLSVFEKQLETNALSDTYHTEFVKIPNHQSIPCWQALGDLSFEDVSSIHVKSESGTLERSGIVGFMCDKWAIMHTIRSRRVASQHFNIENVTHFEYQYRDSYMNNLTMNAVVFVLNDYTVNA